MQQQVFVKERAYLFNPTKDIIPGLIFFLNWIGFAMIKVLSVQEEGYINVLYMIMKGDIQFSLLKKTPSD